MAYSDWSATSDSASSSSIARAVSAGYPVPNGGDTFAYGMNAIISGAAAVALYHNAAAFNPSAANKGGWISAAIQRGIVQSGYSPFIFLCGQGTANTANAYILGLGDANPSHIVLRKGDLATGAPDVAVGSQGVLARSTSTYDMETYYHLKLEAVVNAVGGGLYETVLNVYVSDLGDNDVTSPVWTAITGMSQVIDDAAGVNTGSTPFTNGRFGFGMRSDATGRIAYFDHIAMAVQN